jgi:hypothetical protein
MENARTNLKNLSANQGVSEIFDRIDAVVGLLDRAIEGSREACYEQSPASSDVREQEEIWRTSAESHGQKQRIVKKTGMTSPHHWRNGRWTRTGVLAVN